MASHFDLDRAGDFVLALMHLDVHEGNRAWKGYPWDVLDHLYQQGLISDPKRKAKSVALSEDGLLRATVAFDRLLAEAPASAPPPPSRTAVKASDERASTLNDIQQAQVAKLMAPICASHTDPAIDPQIRVGFRLEGPSVILFSSAPSFRNPQQWLERPVAKFTFVKVSRRWRLFCVFRDLKWRAYEPLPEAPELERLVDEVRRDPTGIFWG
jgi:hypothetical protein